VLSRDDPVVGGSGVTDQTFGFLLKLLVSFGWFVWLRSSFFFGEVLRRRFLDFLLFSCHIGRMLLLAAFRKLFLLLLSVLFLSSLFLSFSSQSLSFNCKSLGFSSFCS